MSLVAAHQPPSSPQSKSIHSIFYQSVSSLLGGPASPDTLSACITQLNDCATALQHTSLVSGITEFQDLKTSDLPLLLTHVHLADAYYRLPVPLPFNPAARLLNLNASMRHYKSFLDIHDLLGFVDTPNRHMDTRSLKISRFKSINANRQLLLDMLDALLGHPNQYIPHSYLNAIKHSLSSSFTTPPLDQDRHDPLFDDESKSRKFIEVLIKYWVGHSLNEIDALSSEVLLLSESADPVPDPSVRLDGVPPQGALLDAKGRPLRPFVLTSQNVQGSVFRPGHRLPTMSLDQYIQADKQRGGILPPATGKQDNASDSDSDKDYDTKEVYKKREWDAFKDDNPRGWGNRKANRG